MIGNGRFRAQLSQVEGLLTRLSLFEERRHAPNKSLGAAHFRGMTYRQVYEECVREYAYDFRLTDQSLLLFVKGGTNQHNGMLSFSYYDCPFHAMTYKEFVGAQSGLTVFDPDYEGVVAEWGDLLRADYEEYLDTLDANVLVTPMRYDYKPTDYRAGVHPASHVHVGFANEVRIATERVMNPMSFTLLIIRQHYPRNWESLLGLGSAKVICRNVREALDNVDGSYRGDADTKELLLH